MNYLINNSINTTVFVGIIVNMANNSTFEVGANTQIQTSVYPEKSYGLSSTVKLVKILDSQNLNPKIV